MPEISRFYGIVVRLFYGDHGPPHFHAEYAGEQVKIGIKDLTVLRGRLAPRALGLVMEWAAMHQSELLTAWERAERQEAPGRISPLG